MVDSPPGSRTSPIATLFPGYFAMVMATGIVAIGSSQQDLDWLAQGLYVIAAAAYVVLAVLLALRVVRFWPAFTADLTNHAKGFAFLTTVAGTNVLGSASAIIHGWWGLAWVLWWLSLVLWAVFVYSTLIAVVIGADKPGLAAGINGTWFLLTVATQSVCVLAALLLPRHDSDLLAFTALAAFTLGVVLYLIVMTMVFLRWTFQPLEPTEADPPAWIAAGAVAITVLAGSNLLLASADSPSDRPGGVLRRGSGHPGLGHGHVLVSADGGHRGVAPSRAAGAAALPPFVLVARVPPGHVRRGDLPHARRHRSDRAGVVAAGHAGGGADRLVGRVRRLGAPGGRCGAADHPGPSPSR